MANCLVYAQPSIDAQNPPIRLCRWLYLNANQRGARPSVFNTVNKICQFRMICCFCLIPGLLQHAHVSGLLDSAFTSFDSDEVVKMVKLADDCHVLELFHGPTLAFKDLGLSCIGRLYDHFLATRKSRCLVLVGEYLKKCVARCWEISVR